MSDRGDGNERVADFSLAGTIAARQAEQYALYGRHINPALTRVQAIIGFDKAWARGEGAYLWDAGGERYLDLIAGYGARDLERDHHILTQVGGPDVNVIKLLPPLIVGEPEEDAVVAAFDAVMTVAGRVRGAEWRQSGRLIKQALSQ